MDATKSSKNLEFESEHTNCFLISDTSAVQEVTRVREGKGTGTEDRAPCAHPHPHTHQRSQARPSQQGRTQPGSRQAGGQPARLSGVTSWIARKPEAKLAVLGSVSRTVELVIRKYPKARWCSAVTSSGPSASFLRVTSHRASPVSFLAPSFFHNWIWPCRILVCAA